MSDTQVAADGKRYPADEVESVNQKVEQERQEAREKAEQEAQERTKQRVDERAETSERYLSTADAEKIDDGAFDVQATNAYENKPKLDPNREPVEFELDKSFTSATGDEAGRRGGGNPDAGGGVLSRTPRAATTEKPGPVTEDDLKPDDGQVEEQQRSASEQAISPNSGDFPKHTGGGWYELSDGSKVQGEDDAIEAQKNL